MLTHACAAVNELCRADGFVNSVHTIEPVRIPVAFLKSRTGSIREG